MDDNETQVKPVPIGVWVFWIIVVITSGIGVAAILLSGHQNKWIYIQTVVYTLTLAAITWTAYLTLKSQRALIRQTNVSIMPIFVAYIGRTYTENERREMVDCLELENIGNGNALNVQVDPVEIVFDDPLVYNVWPEPHILFEGIVSIPKGEGRIIPYVSLYRDAGKLVEAKYSWLAKIKPKWTSRDYEIKIRFMDILGNRYVQVIHAGKNDCWPDVVLSDTSEKKPLTHLPNFNDFTESPLRYR